MKRFAKAAAVFFPVAGLLLWWAQLTFFVSHGTLVQFGVTGYDPRDLLAGHYIRYNVDYGSDSLCANDLGKPRCVCLNTATENGLAKSDWAGPCEARPACELWLAGRCEYGRFLADIERYYIPEEYASELMRAPEDSTVQVIVTDKGRGIVIGYQVLGQPVLDYARARQFAASESVETPTSEP